MPIDKVSRWKIIKDHLIDPAFFEEMSTLLNAVIKERKDNAISYEEYLKKIAHLQPTSSVHNFTFT